MLLLALASASLAADHGVQVRAFPGAIDFAETYAESLDPHYEYADLSATYVGCYDQIGVRDFNLEVPIDNVDLALGEDRITVTIDFGLIYGTDMTLYGLDSDIFDACPEFEAALRYAQITNGRVVADLELDTGFGGFFGEPVLSLRWASPPVVEGDIYTDIATFPDQYLLYFDFVENAIRQSAADALTEALPPLLEEFLGETSYAGDYGGLATQIALSKAEISSTALTMGVDLTLAPAATQACEIGDPGVGPLPTNLRSPYLPLDDPKGADLGVAVTEELIGEALHTAWEAGWFCFQSDTVDDLVAGLEFWIDPDVASLEGWATLDSPPQITATANGIEVVVPDIRMEITGKVNGSRVPIIVAELDLTATATPGFDQGLTSMTLSLVDPTFDFTRVELKHVPTPNAVQGKIEERVEAWAADWARDSMNNVVLFDALYYAWDVALLLDRSETRDGGLELYFELYDVNDPAVDQMPPEAFLDVAQTHKRTAHFEASAVDDRDEPLAYSWQVNGAGWSAWTNETTLDLANLGDGTYTVEVTARDVWLNVDETPASTVITIRGPADEGKGCGCTTAPRSLGSWVLLPLLLWRRRR